MDKNWTTWNTQAMQALDRGDIAQAERAFRQACPLRVVSAMQTGNDRGANSLAQCPQICHCEAPTGPRRPEREARGSALGVQSREGSYDFAGSLSKIRPGAARLPRAQSALAMTIWGQSHFNDALCQSAAPRRAGLSPTLQHIFGSLTKSPPTGPLPAGPRCGRGGRYYAGPRRGHRPSCRSGRGR